MEGTAAVHDSVKSMGVFRKCLETGEKAEAKWKDRYQQYAKKNPDMADAWINALTRFMPKGWECSLLHLPPTRAPWPPAPRPARP